MALSEGTKVGSYEVIGLIGQGGMGEVWQAHDTKLDRDVALKVLPEAFTSDPDRLARFEREAKVLASLNHPNIGSIYGLEEAEGVRALVLELVEGPTLADRIKQGPIPIDEALPIAKQIAEALEAAHEQGVIHRDLKPANVKVKADGMVKVLDFGLAKAMEPEVSGDPSQSPTMTAAASRMGMIMGTAAYMSPEQASGKPVDRRADTWAFGVVLYEMLSRRAFSGEDVSHTLAYVLTKEIEWAALPATIPTPLFRLLRRCLDRDPKRRLRDIGEARFAVEEAQTTAPAEPVAAVAAAPEPMGWLRVRSLLAGLAVGAFIMGLVMWYVWPAETPVVAPTVRTAITLPEGDRLALADLAPSRAGRPSLALSPDGTHLVYAVDRGGQSQLILRPLDRFETRLLPGTEGAFHPFFSPDGEWVAFFTPTELKKISIRSGTPITLARARFPMGASWGPDETIIFTQQEGAQLWRVSASDGGEPEVVLTRNLAEEGGFWWPQILPDGRGVLVSLPSPGGSSVSLAVVSLETDVRRVVVESRSGGHYLPTGHLVYAGEGGVLAVPFDLATLDVTGTPTPVLEGVRQETYGRQAQMTFSTNGLLAYIPGNDLGISTPVWVDRNGGEEPIPLRPNRYGSFDISPDGRRLAIQIAGTTSDIWLYDFARGTEPTKLTVGGNNGFPRWTPDRRRVAFWSDNVGADQADPGGIFWQPVDSGQAEWLVGDLTARPGSWSPDGTLAFHIVTAENGSDIQVVPDTRTRPRHSLLSARRWVSG